MGNIHTKTGDIIDPESEIITHADILETCLRDINKKYLTDDEIWMALTEIKPDMFLQNEEIIKATLIDDTWRFKDHVIFERQLAEAINKYHPGDILGQGAYTIQTRLFIHINNFVNKYHTIDHNSEEFFRCKIEMMEYIPIVANIIKTRYRELIKESMIASKLDSESIIRMDMEKHIRDRRRLIDGTFYKKGDLHANGSIVNRDIQCYDGYVPCLKLLLEC